MRLGISSYTYTWAVGVPGRPPTQPLGVLGLLKKAAALDIGLVQVADNAALDRMTPAELDQFEAHAKALDIEVEVGMRGVTPEKLRGYLQMAERFGSPILRVVLDRGKTNKVNHYLTEDEVVGTLREIVDDFERAGITLAIENHDRYTAATYVRILERVSSDHVGICLDTVNSFGALEGPSVVLDMLAPWTVNLHVKDFEIFRPDHLMGFTIEGRPAGQGRLDVPWLLETMRNLGRDPSVILELWTPPEESLAETIAKEDAWATSSVAYLRQVMKEEGAG